MDFFEAAVAIVLIAAISAISLSKMKLRHLKAAGRPNAETDRLRDEVRQLKERLAVIERITVERENSLERQIESLRDR